MSTKKGRFGNPSNRKPDLAKMAQPSGIADPRTLGGSMAGPGGPRDRNAVLIDATDSVLLDSVDVSVIETVRAGEMNGRATFMILGGRVNKDRSPRSGRVRLRLGRSSCHHYAVAGPG